MRRLRIFIASPGDVPEEREIVSLVVDELRRIVGAVREVELEAVRWETHAWPDIGDDAQAVIDREIGEYDIFVGVMWRRFGTPTRRADSGTGEEFDRAYAAFREHGRPKVMFYFRTTPFYSTRPAELSQFRKVIAFRRKMEKAGVLFWQYDKPLEFERFVREHLLRQILEVPPTPGRSRSRGKGRPAAKPPKPTVPFTIFMSASREDSPRVVSLYRALSAAGFNPWLDIADLLPGQEWEGAIKNAIERADIFLAFLSPASVSKRGYVHRELMLALEAADRRPPSAPFLIPVRLDPVEPPAPLQAYQWVDLFEDNGVERLIATIRRLREGRKLLTGGRPRRSSRGGLTSK